MYGGHITDDWDRRLCKTYLEEYMHPDQLDGELLLAPGFSTPPNMDYMGYHSYISDNLPPESPVLYGLHPNAEIGFLTSTSETLFRTVFELQPREGIVFIANLVFFGYVIRKTRKMLSKLIKY